MELLLDMPEISSKNLDDLLGYLKDGPIKTQNTVENWTTIRELFLLSRESKGRFLVGVITTATAEHVILRTL